ncbi:DUF3168 domain-containing protein [Parabacteroides sp. AF48-14]|uniref:tail completion protein gp17 n=1 Tax=Parabacteroides sp. AF48-14 TaxID=2292052 RepID=UPI000EFDB8DA|nr:DUF3168 domain-containing protein [Parabacteroides sp. AF48-14]RHO65979.1 DUF3168 domain-containing protein [Parabacteroides sp. AF48-14]
MKALEVGRVIKLLLLQNTEVSKLIGKNIFPVVAPEQTEYPFLLYERTNVSPSYTKDRKSFSDSVRVIVTIVCAEYEQSVDVVRAVFKALQGRRGVFEGIDVDEIRMINSNEEFQDDCIIQYIEFEVEIINM